MCDTYNCDYLQQSTFLFQLNLFSVKYRFPFRILRFLPSNHLALLKDRFLKKMFLKRAKTHRLFFSKLSAQIILFTVIENNFRFLWNSFEFEFYLSLHRVPEDVGSMNKISPSIPQHSYNPRGRCCQQWYHLPISSLVFLVCWYQGPFP